MKEFEFYLSKGEVKKQSPDKNTGIATWKDAIDRLDFAKNILNKEKIKFVFENIYEAIREAADAILFIDGYKSYSHEASIIYPLKKGFQEKDVNELDRFRRIRNDCKYFGKDCTTDDVKSALLLAEKLFPKFKDLIETKSLNLN